MHAHCAVCDRAAGPTTAGSGRPAGPHPRTRHAGGSFCRSRPRAGLSLTSSHPFGFRPRGQWVQGPRVNGSGGRLGPAGPSPVGVAATPGLVYPPTPARRHVSAGPPLWDRWFHHPDPLRGGRLGGFGMGSTTRSQRQRSQSRTRVRVGRCPSPGSIPLLDVDNAFT
jgi:hypothetical protein